MCFLIYMGCLKSEVLNDCCLCSEYLCRLQLYMSRLYKYAFHCFILLLSRLLANHDMNVQYNEVIISSSEKRLKKMLSFFYLSFIFVLHQLNVSVWCNLRCRQQNRILGFLLNVCQDPHNDKTSKTGDNYTPLCHYWKTWERMGDLRF